MPLRQYSIASAYPGVLRARYYNQWDVSSRDSKGQLILTDHLHDYYNSVLTNIRSSRGYMTVPGAEDPVLYIPTTSDVNELYARLQGKLRNGGASLGMALASMNQSMEMIVSRYEDINRLMGSALRRSKKRKTKPVRRELASSVLEVEFGWRPFIEDIQNAFKVLTSPKDELLRARVVKRIPVYTFTSYGTTPRKTISISGTARITAAGTYRVTNPNLWLANRLGLINPFQVAWDRVPWSWVVNMFVNVNQMIGSLTDTVGLDNVSGSVTTSSRLLREAIDDWSAVYPHIGVCSANVNTKYRSRSGLSGLRPAFELKLPKFNLELGLIASALAVQRSRTLGG